MKKVIATSLVTLSLLTGCGQDEAQKDYARCNDEYASGTECTEKEFKQFLLMEADNNASLFGGIDNAAPETQQKVINEINDKVDEIFN